jgi:hypothetical protein
MGTVGPFPVDPVLIGVVAAYKNESFIADEVLPRVQVAAQNFKYRVFSAKDAFTIPNTVVGRTGRVPQVEFGYTEADSSCLGYGLEEPVPEVDRANAPAGYNPEARALETLLELIALDRERRTATLVFDANQYAAGNKQTLAAGEKFNNDASDPIKLLLTAMDKCIYRPTDLIIGQQSWTALRMHPRIVKAVHGNAGDSGAAARQAVAEILELKSIMVGQGWYNTANKGQAMTKVRIWGNSAALIYRNAGAGTSGTPTFGITAQWGARTVDVIEDRDMGLTGGKKVKVGEYVRELVVAPDYGFLLQDVLAA